MAVHVTFHKVSDLKTHGGNATMRGDRISNSEEVAIGGVAANTDPAPGGFGSVLIARIVVLDSDCRIEINGAADANSEYWPAGLVEDVLILSGQVISVIAA